MQLPKPVTERRTRTVLQFPQTMAHRACHVPGPLQITLTFPNLPCCIPPNHFLLNSTEAFNPAFQSDVFDQNLAEVCVELNRITLKHAKVSLQLFLETLCNNYPTTLVCPLLGPHIPLYITIHNPYSPGDEGCRALPLTARECIGSRSESLAWRHAQRIEPDQTLGYSLVRFGWPESVEQQPALFYSFCAASIGCCVFFCADVPCKDSCRTQSSLASSGAASRSLT